MAEDCDGGAAADSEARRAELADAFARLDGFAATEGSDVAMVRLLSGMSDEQLRRARAIREF